ncbi:type I-E CRISPR-associated protein Cas5/CasD [Pilimelia anulata]|uniref:Type I-E CRISPR-associated protein Cas5/CasD n=1 Tax=Pilimelia anulata TaxID=53371 RepID=A0A8J3FCQ2_9ACTN|nr:type I-E CRISPR-associated protein Cas5/CasD [Pilimelia anulata]GGJ92630.1 type I-E CRISPR-associated protein Cas5/CasD [Pilimelia anulata]
MSPASLVLRLAGPIQSWGERSRLNRRDTAHAPTKSGVIGLLAAAEGRRRQDPIEDLCALTLGVRTDQPGSLLRDYHTVSDHRGVPLLSASVDRHQRQRSTSPAKLTHVTQRYYLQDAVFVAAVSGPPALLGALAAAVRAPAFPLALGRRSCPPTLPLLLSGDAADGCWSGPVTDVLARVPWQAGPAHRRRYAGAVAAAAIDLPVTHDDPAGTDVRDDLPTTFRPADRGFRSRTVTHGWVTVPTCAAADPAAAGSPPAHDPFALLGW